MHWRRRAQAMSGVHLTALGIVPKRLLLARGLRSLGQGMMVVNFALYLRALGWHGGAIGLLLTASGLAGALLSLVVGYTSDRYGRKNFILVYEAMTVLAAVIAIFSANPWFLSAASIVASFGRGQGGGAGPFGPAEQAWLARDVPAGARAPVFSLNAALGFIGMGVGALAAGIVPFLQPFLPGAAAFRPLFLLVVAGSVVNLMLLRSLPDARASETLARPSAAERAETKRENVSLVKLALANMLNGLAVGLTGPLMSYWFAVRFGISPAAIGALMAASFFATGLSNLASGHLAGRVGAVRSTVVTRLLGVVALVLLPLAGSVSLAFVLYFLRSILNRGSVGARQSVSVSLTRDQRRGLASSLNVVSMRLPASVGPTLAGYMIEQGDLALPLLLGAALQFGYAMMYGFFFHELDQNVKKGPQPDAG